MGYGIGEAFLTETPLAEQALATELFSERIGVGRCNRIQRLKVEVTSPFLPELRVTGSTL